MLQKNNCFNCSGGHALFSCRAIAIHACLLALGVIALFWAKIHYRSVRAIVGFPCPLLLPTTPSPYPLPSAPFPYPTPVDKQCLEGALHLSLPLFFIVLHLYIIYVCNNIASVQFFLKNHSTQVHALSARFDTVLIGHIQHFKNPRLISSFNRKNSSSVLVSDC